MTLLNPPARDPGAENDEVQDDRGRLFAVIALVIAVAWMFIVPPDTSSFWRVMLPPIVIVAVVWALYTSGRRG